MYYLLLNQFQILIVSQDNPLQCLNLKKKI